MVHLERCGGEEAEYGSAMYRIVSIDFGRAPVPATTVKEFLALPGKKQVS